MFIKDKRGQLTLFIVIGILVVVGVGTYFFVSQRGLDVGSNKDLAKKFPEVNSLIESCLENITLEGIYFNSLQGGYYEGKENFLSYGAFSLPVYFSDGKKNLPKLSVWEEELANFIDDNLDFCIDFFDLEKKGYSVEVSNKTEVSVSIKNGSVDVTLNYQITISKEERKVQVKNFKKTIYFDYKGKYEDLSSYLDLQEKEPKWIPFSQLSSLANKSGFFFRTGPLNSSNGKIDYVYLFNYSRTNKYKNEDYLLVFGVRYDEK